jgi:hypothetical protein
LLASAGVAAVTAPFVLRHGYGNDDIRAVLGGNFRRVLGGIWTA